MKNRPVRRVLPAASLGTDGVAMFRARILTAAGVPIVRAGHVAAGKSFGARSVQDGTLDAIVGMSDLAVRGIISRPDSTVVAALCRTLGAKTFFEFGTFAGYTTYAVAHTTRISMS